MIKKCMWCPKESDSIVAFQEVRDQEVGSTQFVCREHLIPGTDPCPIRTYHYEEGRIRFGRETMPLIRRIWDPEKEWEDKLTRRYAWFKANPKVLQGMFRLSWFEDHPTELTR